MTFHDWLLAQNERTDSVGDLARDIRRDLTWPKDKPESNPNQSYRRCRQYLALQSGESSPAMDAFEQAVLEHQKARTETAFMSVQA